jgi:Ca2+-binding EF-hand superfamily protein
VTVDAFVFLIYIGAEETGKTTDITRKQFHVLAREATGNLRKQMGCEEIELLFEFFDYDRTGKVEAESMAAMYDKLCETPEELALQNTTNKSTRHALGLRSDDYD